MFVLVEKPVFAVFQIDTFSWPIVRTDGSVDVHGARKVAENWKEFGLPKMPPPVDGVIDLSYLAEARK